MIEQKANEQCKRHIGTGDTASCISLESLASNTPGDPQLSLPQQRHDDGCRQSQSYTPPGRLRARSCQQRPGTVAYNVAGQREQANGRNPGRPPLSTLDL